MRGEPVRDLTTGSIPRHLLAFALPMLLGNFLNTGYSIINTMWVGHILGGNAVGASAVSFPIIFMLIALASGATSATSILVAQYFGAKDFSKLRRVVFNSFFIAAVLSLVLTALGLRFADHILRLMSTPAPIFPLASGYLKWSLAGIPFLYFYFLLTSILRGTGDSATPLKFLVVSTALNAILDPLLIMGLGPFPRLGLNGAALASLIAQTIALGLATRHVVRNTPLLRLRREEARVDRSMIWIIFRIGFPSMIQQSLVAVGAAFITSFVNAYGASATAAFGAAGRIDSIAMMPSMAMAIAASTLTGQNLGARKPERIKEIFRWGILINTAIVLVVSVGALSFPHLILSAFLHDPAILSIGADYLRITAIGYLFFGVMFVSNGVINGSGHTVITMLITIASLWLLRLPLASVLSHTSLGLRGIWVGTVASWMLSMGLSLAYYASGRWKRSVLRSSPAVPAFSMGDL